MTDKRIYSEVIDCCDSCGHIYHGNCNHPDAPSKEIGDWFDPPPDWCPLPKAEQETEL